MIELTLLRRSSSLANPAEQLKILNSDRNQPSFGQVLRNFGLSPLSATGIEVLQVNLGKLCNQTCRHCHVDAGPDRREVMNRQTVDECLHVLRSADIPTLDLTGGAPELNPHFRHFVDEASKTGRRIIDRSNLTILVVPGFDDLPEFLAHHRVEIVASLPCYLEENCDRQRGEGVFERSIDALRRLNALGYGMPASELQLTLVYNPVGTSLPPAQAQLEADYRRELSERYGISFTRLYTITNMPISRFLDDLLATGRYETYMRTLVDAFNPAAVSGVMCRTMISVDWRGYLFDCDFNQMLDLHVESGVPTHIRDFDVELMAKRRILTGRHCFGCTAGAGSSCQGSIKTARYSS
ncbi:MAG: arsenosugar biosynthesis radical SAM (seleno)protein ArsS [Pirellulales bacterium]